MSFSWRPFLFIQKYLLGVLLLCGFILVVCWLTFKGFVILVLLAPEFSYFKPMLTVIVKTGCDLLPRNAVCCLAPNNISYLGRLPTYFSLNCLCPFVPPESIPILAGLGHILATPESSLMSPCYPTPQLTLS